MIDAETGINETFGMKFSRSKVSKDVFFLNLFVIVICAMIFLGIYSFQMGSPQRYIHGVDSWGNVCGENGNHRKTLHGIGDVKLDHSKRSYEFRVWSNPETSNIDPAAYFQRGHDNTAICVTECPKKEISCDQFMVENGYDKDSWTSKRVCKTPLQKFSPHTPLVYRCITSDAMEVGLHKTSIRLIFYIINSLWNYKCDIMTLTGLSFLIVIALMLGLKRFFKKMTFFLPAVVGSFSMVLVVYFWYEYAIAAMFIPSESNDRKENTLEWQSSGIWSDLLLFRIRHIDCLLPLAIIASAMIVLCTVFIKWYNDKKLRIAEFMAEVNDAMFSITVLLLQKIFALILIMGVIVFFFVIGFYLYSIQEPEVGKDGMVYFVERRKISVIFLSAVIHILGSFWVFQFILGFQYTMVSSATSHWFFTYPTSLWPKPKHRYWPHLKELRDLLKYRIGSLAFGAIFIPLYHLPRNVFGFIEGCVVKGRTAKEAKFWARCCCCGLAWFQAVLQYFHRINYLHVVMFGDSFGEAGRRFASKMNGDVHHKLKLKLIAWMCLFLGKMFVVALTGVFSLVYFVAMYSEFTTRGFILPILVICSFSYMLSSYFLDTYMIVIETMFVCYTKDLKYREGGKRRLGYSSLGFRAIMQRNDVQTGSWSSEVSPASSVSAGSRFHHDIFARTKIPRPKAAKGVRGQKGITPKKKKEDPDAVSTTDESLKSFDMFLQEVMEEGNIILNPSLYKYEIDENRTRPSVRPTFDKLFKRPDQGTQASIKSVSPLTNSSNQPHCSKTRLINLPGQVLDYSSEEECQPQQQSPGRQTVPVDNETVVPASVIPTISETCFPDDLPDESELARHSSFLEKPETTNCWSQAPSTSDEPSKLFLTLPPKSPEPISMVSVDTEE